VGGGRGGGGGRKGRKLMSYQKKRLSSTPKILLVQKERGDNKKPRGTTRKKDVSLDANQKKTLNFWRLRTPLQNVLFPRNGMGKRGGGKRRGNWTKTTLAKIRLEVKAKKSPAGLCISLRSTRQRPHSGQA